MDYPDAPGLGSIDNMEQSSKFRRVKNTFVGVLKNPYYIIVVASILLLFYLIIVPLFEMARSTFFVASADVRRIPGSVVGDFTWFFWVRVFLSEFSSALMYSPLWNSIIIGVSVGGIAVAFGAIVAWLMVRSDLPGKKFFSLVLVVPFMLPSWTIALAWMTVFRTGMRGGGGTTGFLASIGLNVPMWLAYGKFPIIAVLAISNFAFAYLFASGALQSINSELEEMGEIMGAGKLRMLRKITFPLVLPAIVSAFILIFARAIGSFSVPAFLGMRVNYDTISTVLFFSIRMRDNNTGFIISLVLIAIVAITLFVNQRLIGVRKSFATISGKGARSNLISLGKWKYPILVFLTFFCVFAVLFPLVLLLLETVLLVPGRYELSNLSLHYWIGEANPNIARGIPGIFHLPMFWQSLRITIFLTFTVAIIGTLFGQLLGYTISRGRGKLSGRILEQLTFLPFMIPSITLGTIYLSMFAQPRFIIPALYGTFALLLLISVVKNLPFSTRAGISNMLQIGYELEEAASIEGANFFQRFRKIVFPLAKPGFLSGFMLIFVSVIRDLDLIVLLITPRMTTLAYMVWWFIEGTNDSHANAVATFIFLIVFVTYILAKKIGKLDLAASIRGGG